MIPSPIRLAKPKPISRGLLEMFRPDPPAAVMLSDPELIRTNYRSWQKRVLISSIIGYAAFYFVRKNLGIAMPIMEHQLGIGKTSLGLFLTLHGLLYGVSKFANGFFADRANARTFMAAGLILAAVSNVFFGFSSTVIALGVFWMINGWFQGMGFPPCARLLTHWFPPRQLATKMSIWNASHTLGAGLIVILGGYLVTTSWRLCFLVPAAIALCCAVYVLRTVPDTPPSVGLPEVEGTETEATAENAEEDFRAILMRKVFRNPYVWLISLANFFVYTIRYAVLDWGPSVLTQAKHVHISHAGWMVAAFEFSGAFGSLLAGWMTDRFFAGRAAWSCIVFMAMAGVSILLFWLNPYPSEWLNAAILCGAGFFIYGPQCMVGVMAANLGTKRAAATAVGLTGLFGYASTLLSGVGLGALVEHRGWDMGFQGLLIIAAIGTVLFVVALGAKADGYEVAKPKA